MIPRERAGAAAFRRGRGRKLAVSSAPAASSALLGEPAGLFASEERRCLEGLLQALEEVLVVALEELLLAHPGGVAHVDEGSPSLGPGRPRRRTRAGSCSTASTSSARNEYGRLRRSMPSSRPISPTPPSMHEGRRLGEVMAPVAAPVRREHPAGLPVGAGGDHVEAVQQRVAALREATRRHTHGYTHSTRAARRKAPWSAARPWPSSSSRTWLARHRSNSSSGASAAHSTVTPGNASRTDA